MGEIDDIRARQMELRAQREKLAEEERQLNEAIVRVERDEMIKSTPVIIKDIEVIGDLVYFKSPYRTDFIEFLRTFPTRKWDGGRNYISATQWKKFAEEVALLPNVTIELENGVKEKVENWKPLPPYHVQMDDRSIKVVCSLQASDSWKIGAIQGAERYSLKNQNIYRLPYLEAWRLVDMLHEKEGVIWDEDALQYCEDQLEKRRKIDELVKAGKTETQITLNGWALKEYQNIFVDFARLASFNLINADPMGLGKTPETIGALTILDEIYGNDSKHLIICPAAGRANFTYQLWKFLREKPYEMFGREPSSVDLIQVLKGNYKYYMCNYDMISYKYEDKAVEYIDPESGDKHVKPARTRRPWIELFNLADFKSVTVDEAHKIKNLDSGRTQAVRALNIPHKMLLTGTPMANGRPSELWPLINWIDPKLIGSYDSFVQRYTSSDGKTIRNVEELREILKPIMIRRLKKDIMPDLDPINRIEQIFTLSDSARRAYNKLLEGFWIAFDEWDMSDPNQNTVVTSLLAQLMKMKQIVAWDKIETTADTVLEIHENLKEAGDKCKVIVFTQFVNSPECVHQIALRLADLGVIEVTGEMDGADRTNLVRDKFQNDPSINIAVCSTMAASEVLDMTEAGAVVFHDLMWTPKDHDQAEGRAYGRANDPHSIDSYYILGEDTIEMDIRELLANKQARSESVIEGAELSRDSSVLMDLLKKLKSRRGNK